MKAKVYDHNLKETAKMVELNDKIWKKKMNEDLVSQAIYVFSSNRRQGSAAAKTRAQVRGGGRKPHPQKGTGRARAGSIRSPLWVGGGVTFTPTNRNWSKKMNKKMKNAALAAVLSQMLSDEDLYFVNMEKIERDSFKNNEKYLVLSQSEDIRKKLRNLSNVRVADPQELNALIALQGGKICFEVGLIENFEKRFENGK